MTETLKVLSLASRMARHAGAQQAVAAENIAHANTPGYKAKRVEQFLALVDSPAPTEFRMTRAGHMSARDVPQSFRVAEDKFAPEAPNGNSVTLESEIFASVAAERQQSRALAVYESALSILKTSIGRGR